MLVSISSITTCGTGSARRWAQASTGILHAKRKGRAMLLVCAMALLSVNAGCQTPQSFAFWNKQEPKVDYTTPEDTFVMRGGEMVLDPGIPVLGGDFEGARRMYRDKEFDKAEPIFAHVADNKKNTLPVLETARYYQAMCLYNQGKYPSASERFIQLLNNFPSAAHGQEAREHLFNIANYWLDETRDQMEQAKDVKEGKRWMTMPIMPVHFETAKPLLDIEGHALRVLEAVYMTDPLSTGDPKALLGEKALFYMGSVKFYREDYRDADHYFYQLVQNYRNGKYAAKALQLSIICKEICQGGPDYDGRRLQEARDLIERAKVAYPELQKTQGEWLNKQAVEIHNIQAEKDYDIARQFERTGHPGSAYFYYELVCRRYPGTTFAEKSHKKVEELRALADRENAQTPSPAVQPGNPGNPGAPGSEAGPMPRPVNPGPPMPPVGGGGQYGPSPRTLPPGLEGPR
jgi:TolA-binding protein